MTITIVGAGVIGCAIAHALAARGAHVQVVDPRSAGGGATRASAGILSPHIEGHSETLLALCLRSFEEYDAFVARVRSDTNRAVPYERAGTLQVARDAGEEAELRTLARELAERGVPHALMATDALRQLEPALDHRVTTGLLVEQHGYVNPRALTAALMDAARRHGATFARRRVTAIHEAPGGVRVAMDAATLETDAVVIAAGSWSAQVAAAPAGPPAVTPIRGQLVQLRLEVPVLSRVIWGTQCYLVPWRDGTVLVGATVEDVGFDERSTVDAVTTLMEAATELVPALRTAAFHRVRVGLRPATSDALPLIGRSSRLPQVFYATGHYRAGVLLAPLTARLIADLVLDGREGRELALVGPGRVGL